ncbi:LeoA protein [Helicobacter sp. NHP21005]|uniref:LeoA/HP0731 family dynamin-like GTPase n=1 Tax=Helicobacter felistomachi TaxID=3040201 RepID=UPI00257434AB|nr:LeoA/HP0731 family dynamin-like GTPase [Helicobacter sp. NHP21005]BEG57800.1 LeoA protein [Helicobacter sp. NHP21005]
MQGLDKSGQMGALLDALAEFMREGEGLGMVEERGFEEKIAHAKEQGILQVVLVGEFSCGKTSIAAAWLGDLEQAKKMKIAHEESTDEVKTYAVKGGIVLVDTPGLFGFKEKYGADGVQKYKDITHKYVSEAHLVLYVMDPSNPIKESQHEELRWLFQELDLLPRSVFVLSKFDEVVNLKNEEGYKRTLEIKKETVCKELQRIISLEQAQKLDIVAVAANPYDEGIDHWLKHPEEFGQLSRIGLLQQATEAKIKANGAQRLALESVKSTMIALLHPPLKKGRAALEAVCQEIETLDEKCRGMSLEFEHLKETIDNAKTSLEAFCKQHFERLLEALSQTDLHNIKDFIERWIGEEGEVLRRVLEERFKLEEDELRLEFAEIGNKWKEEGMGGAYGFHYQESKFEEFLSMLKKLFESATFAAVLTSFVEALGGILGKAASFIKGTTILAALTLLLELIDLMMRAKAEAELEEFKKELKAKLETLQEDILALIRKHHAQVLQACQASQDTDLEKLKQRIQECQDYKETLESWLKKGTDIEAHIRP